MKFKVYDTNIVGIKPDDIVYVGSDSSDVMRIDDTRRMTLCILHEVEIKIDTNGITVEGIRNGDSVYFEANVIPDEGNAYLNWTEKKLTD